MHLVKKYKLRYGMKKIFLGTLIAVLAFLNLILLGINTFKINTRPNSFAQNPPIQSNIGTTTLAINDTVHANQETPLRRTPPLLEVNILTTVPQGSQGSITSGPIHAANKWWWQVDFGSGKKGWVNEDALTKEGLNTALSVVTPTLNPSTTGLGIQAPRIILYGPQNGSTVRNSQVTLRGMVTDNVSAPSQLLFFINSRVVKLASDGTFSVNLKLKPGNNNFSFFVQGPDGNPAQQINDITSFIDASVVYGSDPTRANALRTFKDGMLKTSANDLPPLNTVGLPNANDAHIVPDNQLFLAGDVRGNENIGLTALQTLFIREHNTIASILKKEHPRLGDEAIYQWSRRIVIAEIQSVTFNEFLPSLFGPHAPSTYPGYNPKINPEVANEFANGAYRLGHSMVDTDIHFFNNADQDTTPSVPLRDAFFNPTAVEQNNVGGILKYFTGDNEQEIDPLVIDDLRNFLFGPPGAGGFDLASLNIQRGRDVGLGDYNTVRQAYGLPRVRSFSQITSNVTLQNKLKALYGNVNNIDLWVGGLSEDHLPNSDVGPTFTKIVTDQFERARDGDRYWYQRMYHGKTLTDLNSVNLADIIRRNTTITNLQNNVFLFTDNRTVMNNIPQSVAMAKLVTLVNEIPQPNPKDYESIDGHGNNLSNPTWGQAGNDFLRMAPAGYSDGVDSLAGSTRPSARVISNSVNAMSGNPDDFSSSTLSNMVWGWGQFMDHDLDLSDAGTTPANVQVPKGDPSFDPHNTGTQVIQLDRDTIDPSSGTGTTKAAQQNYRLVYKNSRF
jgi:heme peroxidase/glucodextranase-like protein